MVRSSEAGFLSIEWVGGLDGCLRLIDQTRLPEEVVHLDCRDAESVWHAIKRLSVRGAPAIGISAAYGLVLAVRHGGENDHAAFLRKVDEAAQYFAGSRPTAVNLFWALERMRRVAHQSECSDVAELKQRLLAEATKIHDEDAAMCRAIGEHGLPLIQDGAGILTHCNAGGLATAELGTALAPMFLAHARGLRIHVFADETRPLLQGARLTAWELQQAGIDVTVLCDNMAAQLMRSGQVDLVITGADRIAANGDAANKIGTYGVAVLAKAHDIPFYVAAPSSTFDLATPDGDAIPIETRSDDEIRRGFGRQTVPDGVACHCPAFDVTPAHLIRGIVTERGLISPVTQENIARIVG
jgi:methylthioribose-1-phosphate isomerase